MKNRKIQDLKMKDQIWGSQKVGNAVFDIFVHTAGNM